MLVLTRPSCLADGLGHLGVAVPDERHVVHAVQVLVTVDVIEVLPAAASHVDRVVRVEHGQVRRQVRSAALQQPFGVAAHSASISRSSSRHAGASETLRYASPGTTAALVGGDAHAHRESGSDQIVEHSRSTAWSGRCRSYPAISRSRTAYGSGRSSIAYAHATAGSTTKRSVDRVAEVDQTADPVSVDEHVVIVGVVVDDPARQLVAAAAATWSAKRVATWSINARRARALHSVGIRIEDEWRPGDVPLQNAMRGGMVEVVERDGSPPPTRVPGRRTPRVQDRWSPASCRAGIRSPSSSARPAATDQWPSAVGSGSGHGSPAACSRCIIWRCRSRWAASSARLAILATATGLPSMRTSQFWSRSETSGDSSPSRPHRFMQVGAYLRRGEVRTAGQLAQRHGSSPAWSASAAARTPTSSVIAVSSTTCSPGRNRALCSAPASMPVPTNIIRVGSLSA